MAKATKQSAPAKRQPRDLVPGDVVNVLASDPDEQYVVQVGQSVVEFLKGLAGFFTTAKAIEVEALATLDKAKALVVPTTKDEDEQLQVFIRNTSAQMRTATEHWKITSLVSQFHRRLTTRRAKTTDALEVANAQANNLHNRYVENERRRAAQEQERIRREAEERARQEREAEIARMEAEAVKREEASADLSEREKMFVEYFAAGPYAANGQRCAALAGYKDPLVQGSRLVSSAKIQKAIKAKREAIAIREQAQATKQAPLDVQVETVAPQVSRGAGGVERTTHSAELLDETALIKAILAGTPGIPTDLLRIDTRVLNEYARSMQEKINAWPGVKYVATTKLVG